MMKFTPYDAFSIVYEGNGKYLLRGTLLDQGAKDSCWDRISVHKKVIRAIDKAQAWKKKTGRRATTYISEGCAIIAKIEYQCSPSQR